MQSHRYKRVQAQRKFAAGAYIPPSASSNTIIERRNDLAPCKEDASVVHCNMTANNFLDMIAFQNLHKHREPVVVLERLRALPLGGRKRRPSPAPPSACSQSACSEQTDEDDRPLHYIAQRLRRKSPRKARNRKESVLVGVTKRGKSGPRKELGRVATSRIVRRVALRRSSRQQALPVKRKKSSAEARQETLASRRRNEPTTSERRQELPLSKQRHEVPPPATRKRASNGVRKSPTKRSPPQPAPVPDESPPRRRAAEPRSSPTTRNVQVVKVWLRKIRQDSTEGTERAHAGAERARGAAGAAPGGRFKVPRMPPRREGRTGTRYKLPDTTTGDDPDPNPESTQSHVDDSAATPAATLAKAPAPATPTIESCLDVARSLADVPTPPVDLVTSPVDVTLRDDNSSPAMAACPTPTPVAAVPVAATPPAATPPPPVAISSAAGDVAAWNMTPESASIPSTVDLSNDDDGGNDGKADDDVCVSVPADDDVVEVVPEGAAGCSNPAARPPCVPLPSVWGSPDCISRQFNTVRSIVDADESELTACCMKCAPCARIAQIRRLARLVAQRARDSEDVYEFRAEREENPRPPHFRPSRAPPGSPYCGLSCRSLSVSAPASAPSTSGAALNEYPKYLDLYPLEERLIVEINSIQTKGRMMMTARLVPRTTARVNNQLSLIDHDLLLIDLFGQWMKYMVDSGEIQRSRPVPTLREVQASAEAAGGSAQKASGAAPAATSRASYMPHKCEVEVPSTVHDDTSARPIEASAKSTDTHVECTTRTHGSSVPEEMRDFCIPESGSEADEASRDAPSEREVRSVRSMFELMTKMDLEIEEAESPSETPKLHYDDDSEPLPAASDASPFVISDVYSKREIEDTKPSALKPELSVNDSQQNTGCTLSSTVKVLDEDEESQPQPSTSRMSTRRQSDLRTQNVCTGDKVVDEDEESQPQPSTSRMSTRRQSDLRSQNTASKNRNTDSPNPLKRKKRKSTVGARDSPQPRRDRSTPPLRKGEAPQAKKPAKRAEAANLPPEAHNSYMNDKCFRDAPIFYPSEEEFKDPLIFFSKISEIASEYGLCKVVAPSSFRPSCALGEDVRFSVANQYLSRLFCRWGAASREMCAIKAYLAEQKVFFTRPPLIDGIELNLPKLYRTVQQHGGLKKVIEKKRWARVAEDMRFPRGPRSAQRIDQLYVKHLLPYDTLSAAERKALLEKVERSWSRNYHRMVRRARNPLRRQTRLLEDSASDADSDDEEKAESDEEEDANLAVALAEAEDCVVAGRNMNLSVFKKVAENVMCNLFGQPEPSPERVEELYWELVGGAAEHVCVNSASIDTGDEGYGFTRHKDDPYHRHPWNLKMLSQNSGNVLRSLGPVLGVTVPTLHLGMVLATSCWHRDPHGLPWVEYLHQGPAKIWYGIPDELSGEFRAAVEALCPTACQNKSIWLPSDITMVPPALLAARGVPLSRVVQRPGEFIVVMPKAYSSSISTGYTMSESVYFATSSWLTDVANVFQELRDSCEPTMFSLEQLLIAVALDPRSPAPVLAAVRPTLAAIVGDELRARRDLVALGLPLDAPDTPVGSCHRQKKKPAGAWNVREQDECEVCRATLYLSKVTGLSSKRSSFCPRHALCVLRRRGGVAGDALVTVFVPQRELHDALARVGGHDAPTAAT